ncbi:MAG: hypothetical protein IIY70_02480 [Oscillospiraceae bacterium]|nr:hypothetical protein [Oscillospiraceae bacterium]
MPKKNQICSILPVLASAILFLAFPGQAAEGVRVGLQLCASVLIPSLFPLSVLTGCMIRMGAADWFRGRIGAGLGRLFRCSSTEMIAVGIGLVGGYPLGAMILSELYQNGSLSRQQANHAAALCNHAGPAFLIGAVGAGVFQKARVGAELWLIQLLSLLLTAWLLPEDHSSIPAAPPSPQAQCCSFSAAFPTALESSALAMLRLSGTVAFFSAFHRVLTTLIPLTMLPQFWQAGLYGVLELSGGVSLLGSLERDSAFVLSAVLCVWGGLCVHAQSLQVFSAAGLSTGSYLSGKFVQAILAGLLAMLRLAARQLSLPSAAFWSFLLFVGLLLGFFAKIHWKMKKTVV